MSRKKIVIIVFCCMHFLGCTNVAASKYGEKKMNNVCDLPEDIAAFNDYMSTKYGDVISEISITEINKEFSEIKDEFTKDPYYSRTEDVRLLGFSKKCTASDDVSYEWQMIATMDSRGNPIFHQTYLLYKTEDFFNGKRKFSFKNIHGSNTDYEKLISKETVGILNSQELSGYMNQLGCVKIPPKNGDKSLEHYLYKIDTNHDMASRLAGWDFSKEIIIHYGSNKMVNQIQVRNSN